MSTTNPTPASDSPQLIGFECRVCDTRMYGRPDQVGKKLKCPDCGAGTVVPPPPKPKPKNIPAALEGEQYELWGVDEQPLPSELVARQPVYIAVRCSRCDTLMYAGENQVGRTIACPDCGRKHVVPAPKKPVARPSVLARDADTPMLDPNAAPGERPTTVPVTTRGMSFEEVQEAAYARALEKSKRTGKPMELDARGRPVLPRWPLISGIVAFPFSAGCRERWVALVFMLLLALGLVIDGVPGWANWQGDSLGHMKAMGGLAETMFGAIFAILWTAAAANVMIAIVSQSAVGNNRITDWPPMNFIASIGEMLPVVVALVFNAAPGWMLARLVAQEAWQAWLLVGGTLIVGFPLTLLSQLAGNSTWELIDLKVLGAMVRRPFSMLFFYAQSACLLAACVGATVAVVPHNEYLPLALVPLYVGCLLLYARLLGRLAWILSEAIPGELI